MRSLKGHVILLVVLLLTVLPRVYADRGGFSPLKERVSESGQKAVIAWNGTDEILMLSTDVSSSRKSEVVELMPLPSNPTISRGEKQSFTKVQELVNTYLAVAGPRTFSEWQGGSDDTTEPPKITITFQEVIGVHYLTVVKAEEAADLIQWLESFLETKGYTSEMPSNLEELFSYYIQNRMNFFVIDAIETTSTVKTVDPLVYEFRSSTLYYPLRISTLFSGDTDISLFTITNTELNDDSIIGEGFVKKAQFQIKNEALAEIHINITELFSANPYMCYFKFNGALEGFEGDISAGFIRGLDIPTLTLALLSLGSGFVVVILLFPVDRIGRLFYGRRSTSSN